MGTCVAFNKVQEEPRFWTTTSTGKMQMPLSVRHFNYDREFYVFFSKKQKTKKTPKGATVTSQTKELGKQVSLAILWPWPLQKTTLSASTTLRDP